MSAVLIFWMALRIKIRFMHLHNKSNVVKESSLRDNCICVSCLGAALIGLCSALDITLLKQFAFLCSYAVEFRFYAQLGMY